MDWKTTFWQDFSIADIFGEHAIRDTYNRAKDEWASNTEYVTELVIVLNHKIWQHYNNNNTTLAKIYDELWRELHDYCLNTLKGDDLRYYIQTTD